jgi:hypothetical protein
LEGYHETNTLHSKPIDSRRARDIKHDSRPVFARFFHHHLPISSGLYRPISSGLYRPISSGCDLLLLAPGSVIPDILRIALATECRALIEFAVLSMVHQYHSIQLDRDLRTEVSCTSSAAKVRHISRRCTSDHGHIRYKRPVGFERPAAGAIC